MSDVLLRTTATLPSADKFDDNNTLFRPTEPIKLAPFVRNVSEITPQSAAALGKNNIRFEIPKTEGDIAAKVWIKGELNALPAPTGGASYVRWCDYIGYALIKELRLKYGSSVLQTWRKEDFFVFHNTYYDDSGQLREDVNVNGNVVPAKRTWQARRPVKFRACLHNVFFGDDASKAFQVQGASQKLTFELDTEQDRALIQSDGATNNIFLADPTQYFSNLVLQVEMYHVLRRERDMGVQMYSNPRGMRLLMDDTQWHTGSRLNSTELLDGTEVSLELKNFNMPTKFLAIFFRWTGDLARTCSSAGPSDTYGTLAGGIGGADWFNIAGWASPLRTPVADSYGPATPMFTHIAIKSGTNYLLRKTPVEELINDTQGRWFKGTPGLGVLLVPFSHLPTMTNSCTGGIDFGVVDTPQLVLTKSSSPNGGYSNVGAYASADIGDSSSGCQIDVCAIVYNNIDIQSFDIHKPF